MSARRFVFPALAFALSTLVALSTGTAQDKKDEKKKDDKKAEKKLPEPSIPPTAAKTGTAASRGLRRLPTTSCAIADHRAGC